MPTVIVLANHIYDETPEKRTRGESFEASREFIDMVLDGDEAAGREPRITEIKQKRTKKGGGDEEK